MGDQEGITGQIRGTVEQLTQASLARIMATLTPLVEQVQTSVRQIQEWVNSGQAQQTIDDLSEQVERLIRERGPELEERLLQRLETLRHQQQDIIRRVESLADRRRGRSTVVATAPSAKKSTAKKAAAKKSTAKKSTAKKPTAKKSTAKKSTAKKSTGRSSSTGGSTS